MFEHIEGYYDLLYLLNKDAFKKGKVRLASGQESDFYIDCKQIAFTGRGQSLIGNIFYQMLEDFEKGGNTIDACGGMALGAVPLACALSFTTFLRNKRDLPCLAVRTQMKTHGMGKTVEGATKLKPKALILLVEDVITTGSSFVPFM